MSTIHSWCREWQCFLTWGLAQCLTPVSIKWVQWYNNIVGRDNIVAKDGGVNQVQDKIKSVMATEAEQTPKWCF